jgi:hypothetical protein
LQVGGEGTKDAHRGIAGAFGHGGVDLGVADVQPRGVVVDLGQGVQFGRLGLRGLIFGWAGQNGFTELAHGDGAFHTAA